MAQSRIQRAVILAAGTGSRLSGGFYVDGNAALDSSLPCPKPLRPVLGKPLLVRVLGTLRSAGVREAVIVVGYQSERIKRELRAELFAAGVDIDLEFVENSNYLAKNGVSLLSAAPFVDRECFLSMADHLYSRKLVRRLARAELPKGACGLGVDYDIPRCFDLDDATKVRVEGGRIVDIAKELPAYDALDTGVFRIGPSLIAELNTVYDRQGDCSLSDGVKALSQKGNFWACDVGNARWIDVDTPSAYVEAERQLELYGEDLSGLGLPGLGWLPSPGTWAPAWQRFSSALRRRTAMPLPSDAE